MADWYAMHDLPAGRCRVRVLWQGREFVAARMVHPRTKRLAWCLPPHGGDEPTEWLPRRRDSDWPDEPECWQPVDLKQWTWPNNAAPPAPLPVRVEPQFYSGDGRRRWASMAEQAAKSERTQARIAAEVAAEFGPEAPPPAARRLGSRWWREGHLVTYSPPGAVSLEEAEGRVCRAVLTDGLRPGERPQAWQGVGTALADLTHEALTSDESAGWARDFEPSPVDLGDDAAMTWFAALDPPQLRRRRDAWSLVTVQEVIVLHALGYAWRQAGRRLGMSHERARQLYMGGPGRLGAVEMVRRAANGRPVYPWLPAADPMADLRRRNRQARLQDREGGRTG